MVADNHSVEICDMIRQSHHHLPLLSLCSFTSLGLNTVTTETVHLTLLTRPPHPLGNVSAQEDCWMWIRSRKCYLEILEKILTQDFKFDENIVRRLTKKQAVMTKEFWMLLPLPHLEQALHQFIGRKINNLFSKAITLINLAQEYLCFYLQIHISKGWPKQKKKFLASFSLDEWPETDPTHLAPAGLKNVL